MLRGLFQRRKSSDPDDVELARHGVEHLVRLFRAVDLEVVHEGGRVSVAGRRIDVDVHTEHKLRRGEAYVIAAAFRILLDSFRHVDIDGQVLYHGSIAIRSNANYGEAASERFLREIASLALPLLGDRGRFRSATIKVSVQDAYVKDGECLVNGIVSPVLLSKLREMSWPTGEAAFLYTLFFVAPPALK